MHLPNLAGEANQSEALSWSKSASSKLESFDTLDSGEVEQ